jgi:DNA-binding GntR family transcriptional regulator
MTGDNKKVSMLSSTKEKHSLKVIDEKGRTKPNGPKETLSRHTAYEAIKEKIFYLDLRPGTKISENEIAKSLNMGRTPVREALLLLEKEGLIEIKAGSGFNVRWFRVEELDDYRLLRTNMEEISIAMAIQRITEAELESLKESVKYLEKYVGDNNIRNVIRYESKFHDIIYKATKSDVIRETLSGLNDKFLWMRAAALTRKGAAAEFLGHHKRILRAIEKKDVKEAKKLIRLHMKKGSEKLRDVTWLLR